MALSADDGPGSGASRSDAAARCRHRHPQGLGPPRRRAVPGNDPPDPPALGPCTGAAVLRERGPPDSQVTLRLPPQEDGADAESVLARMMSPPLFPIRPRNLRGDWTFDVLPPDAFTAPGCTVGSFRVMARDVPHKGGRTVGYRVSDGHSTIAYIPDHCPTELGAGPEGWGEYHPAVLELARDVDVLIHDAHLVPEEVPAEASFGHAAADYAVELGRRAGARKVALFHHRPDRTDDALDRLVERFSRCSRACSGPQTAWNSRCEARPTPSWWARVPTASPPR